MIHSIQRQNDSFNTSHTCIRINTFYQLSGFKFKLHVYELCNYLTSFILYLVCDYCLSILVTNSRWKQDSLFNICILDQVFCPLMIGGNHLSWYSVFHHFCSVICDWSQGASFHTSFELHLVTVQMSTDKTVLDKYHHPGP